MNQKEENMFKLLADFFASLAGTHKHEAINHTEMKQVTKALEANKAIVAQQLESIAELKEEIQERAKQLVHLTGQLEKSVQESDAISGELAKTQTEMTELKDKLREAQNNKVATLEVRQINSQLRKELGELHDEQEQAITMLKSFEVEMRKN